MILSTIVLGALVAVGCGPKGRNLTTDQGTMAEGDRLRKSEFFEEARKQYFRIRTEFPQSQLQVEADLKIADSYFEEEAYAAAANAYEEFIKTYPGRPEVPEAVYKLGMSYVRQMPNTAQRDTRATHKVIDTFTRLLIDYPNSPKAAEAQKHIEEARTQLASKIFEIGRFYEKQGHFDSAARRYAELLQQFPDHTLAEESMAREVACLRKLKQDEKAEETASAFNRKYPNSKFGSLVKK